MTSSKEELEHLLSIMKIEQEEDRLQYKEKVLQSPLNERKRTGITWYPIVIKESYYGVGERLVLEIERPTNKEIPHQFTAGKAASLFCNNGDGKDNPSISGVINGAGLNNLKLTLFVDELPDWASQGKLGLDLLFDETSYKEMELAVNRVNKARNCRLEDLREILLGHQEPQFDQEVKEVVIPELNESQNKALNNVLKAKDVAIIHGPPGTGKTTTLISAIAEKLKSEKQILVCAASNTAVDLLTEKLHQKGISVLRFGNPSRISEELQMHSVDFKITNHKDFKQIKELKKRSIEFRNMALKYKRNFGREERNQRKLIQDEARKIQADALNIEKYIVQDLINTTQVFTTTLVGSANHLIRDKNFGIVFIDEAGQALEPATWIPILRADKIIFAGDHLQLPPTVKSLEAGKQGLNVTLFEKTIQRQKVDVMLETQYRMHEDIMKFSSERFYGGKLIAHSSVNKATLGTGEDILERPVEFIDTAGCSFEEKLEKESVSTYNEEEVNLLFKHLSLLHTSLLNTKIPVNKISVGIISPYKAQVSLMKEKLNEYPELISSPIRVSINTVDGFQGQERDIIYISMVRSNDRGEIGFLGDTRRMNVAITRAKKKLVLIGDSATLSQHKFYKDYLDYIDSINAYKSAWEYLES